MDLSTWKAVHPIGTKVERPPAQLADCSRRHPDFAGAAAVALGLAVGWQDQVPPPHWAAYKKTPAVRAGNSCSP